MSLWQQNYDPAGNIWLSSLIASLPILFFFFALIKLKLKGYLAATYTVAIALMVLGLIVAWNCLKELLHVKPGSMPDEESEWSELGRKRYAAAQTDAKAPKTTSETVTE